MASQAEITAQLNAVAEKQTKTIGEIQVLQGTVTTLNTTVAELQAIIAAGGTIGQELVDAAQRVADLAQQTDEQIPDVPTP